MPDDSDVHPVATPPTPSPVRGDKAGKQVSGLSLAEELFLLLLDEQSGALRPVAQRAASLAFGGAVLMELQFANRIDSDPETLVLIDPSPLGDDLLDPALAEIAAAEERRDLVFWVERAAEWGDDVEEKVIARLARREILLEPDPGGVLSLSPQVARTRRYPSSDGAEREHVALRIMRLLFDREVPVPPLPTPEDVAIVCLANACDLFPLLLSPSELEKARPRIDLISRMDLVGQTIIRVVRLVQPALQTEARALSGKLPVAPRLPLFGNTLEAARDPLGLMREQYRRLGPVFRLRVATDDITVLAGPEANLFMLRKERLYLRAIDGWARAAREMGSSRLMLGTDGDIHVRMRRGMKNGFSADPFLRRLPEAADIVREEIARWPLNAPLPAYPACRRIVLGQVCALSLNTAAAVEHLDDIALFMDMVIHRLAPSLLPVLNPIPFRRAHQRLEKFVAEMLAAHQLRQTTRAPDLVDDLIAMHRSDPAFLAETELKTGILHAFLATAHTSPATTAFMLYFLLKHPDLHERARAEADALFAGGPPMAEGIRKLDVIRRTTMETLRLCPPVTMTQRKVVNAFDFGGYRIPAGGDVYLPFSATHRLPECFPEPERFDIDRYLPGRDEHRQPGAYAPFGLGLHRCIGGGFAEAQLALNIATLLHHAVFELDPPGYEMKLARPHFMMAPHRRFRIRVVSRR